MKVWLKKDKWTGDIATATLASWQQTTIKYGNDFFYDFLFYADFNCVKKHYTAKALLTAGESALLRAGMTIYVKH